jgi:hypothetical protein
VPKKKRHPDEVERDRVKVAEMYLQGKSQSAIAKVFKVSQQQIAYDLKIIRQRWLESSIRDFDAAKSEELAKIDLIESEAWDAWLKSKQFKETTTTEKGKAPGGDVDKTSIKKEAREGDPRFLGIVDNCIRRRCAILGIDAELKYQDVNVAIASLHKLGYKVTVPDEDEQANATPENEITDSEE